MSGGAGGKDTIHHIHAHFGIFDDFFGSANAHKVAWLVFGQILQRGFDNFAREMARFANAEASDGIAGKADFDGALGGFLAQGGIHAALDDAEESLRGAVALAREIPRHFVLMRFEMIFAAFGPAQRQLHGVPHSLRISGILGALVEGHDDVCTEADLCVHRALRAKKMRGAIEVRAESHAFFSDFTQLVQTKNLKSSGVGKDGTRPCHETMQTAKLANLLNSGAEIKVISVAEKNLHAEI